MPSLFLELLSEEIPARMQARAADALARLVSDALARLSPHAARCFHGPRRLALALELAGAPPESQRRERGPRLGAPEQALAGFLRKHHATRADLTVDSGFYVLDQQDPATSAAALIAASLPKILWTFPWPKTMRWGGTSAFTWVRPLRRITCLLDGAVVPFALARGNDAAHGLTSDRLSEGHRVLAPGAFTVESVTHWQEALRARSVIADPGERRAAIATGLAAAAAAEDLTLVADAALLDEVTGLVEWPVPLLGAIEPAFLELPAEILQVSMRVHQRYFALRDRDGRPAPRFAFVANIDTEDGGAAIVAGNARVLAARFADARHFWQRDRGVTLASRLPALATITFHAQLGTQRQRAARIEAIAARLAPLLGADPALAARAGLLAKADLTTGLVGEFPELQGIIGGHYARHDGEPEAVADAVRDHYAPRGPNDAVPAAPLTCTVALADKLDTLVGFFGIGAMPTGSGDPYALRRAALGVLRIVRDNRLRLGLRSLLTAAGAEGAVAEALLGFLAERLRVQLRAEGARHDVLAAVLATPDAGDDVVRLLTRTEAVAALLATKDGTDLLAAARRAANILRIEEKKDGRYHPPPDPGLLIDPAERALAEALTAAERRIGPALAAEHDGEAMAAMAALRPPLDRFFAEVTVNAPQPELRHNRLRLLAQIRSTLEQGADFAEIEG